MSVEIMNQQFAIDGKVSFVAGKNGQPRADLTLGGASASVYLLGATLTSFQDEPGRDIIWVSESANYAPGKAIRGGVPICWPQFGPGNLVQHGFARTSQFIVAETMHTDSMVSLTLRLTETPDTMAIWPHRFELDVTFELHHSGTARPSLRQQLLVRNNSNTGISFTTALHTYFTVPHIKDVEVTPLHKHKFFDKVTSTEKVQEEPTVTFSGETDRVYYGMPSKVTISSTDASHPHTVVTQENFTDVVLWNPGAEKAKGMADLSDWQTFVCVESGAIQNPVLLPSGETWKAHHVISRHTPCSL